MTNLGFATHSTDQQSTGKHSGNKSTGKHSGNNSGSGGSRSATDTPGSTNSNSFPGGYGSGLVHQSTCGACIRVALGPAFAGDGSVARTPYFTWAPKCGVFTLPNKLSAATGGRSILRPSSAASHHANDQTPSISGRTTPSHAPAPKPIAAPLANGRKKPDESTITAGSRASKYSMSA